jgi:hypothetical protein
VIVDCRLKQALRGWEDSVKLTPRLSNGSISRLDRARRIWVDERMPSQKEAISTMTWSYFV